MRDLLMRFWRDEAGTASIEYLIVAGMVSVMIISAATVIGSKTANSFQNLAANL